MRERNMTKGRRTGRDKNDNNGYAPPHPDLEAATTLSDSDPEIPFTFGRKKAVENAVVCNRYIRDRDTEKWRRRKQRIRGTGGISNRDRDKR